MSGLAAVLASHHKAGVYRWHAAFAADQVEHTVELAGWQFGHLDGWGSETKAEFLSGIAAALDFPDYFGNNFDALADCLADLGDGKPGVVLLWDGWGPFAYADLDAFAVALDVLRQRADDDKRPFGVLLRGGGPDLPDVPWLD